MRQNSVYAIYVYRLFFLLIFVAVPLEISFKKKNTNEKQNKGIETKTVLKILILIKSDVRQITFNMQTNQPIRREGGKKSLART